MKNQGFGVRLFLLYHISPRLHTSQMQKGPHPWMGTDLPARRKRNGDVLTGFNTLPRCFRRLLFQIHCRSFQGGSQASPDACHTKPSGWFSVFHFSHFGANRLVPSLSLPWSARLVLHLGFDWTHRNYKCRNLLISPVSGQFSRPNLKLLSVLSASSPC